jgi:hypothetical protein
MKKDRLVLKLSLSALFVLSLVGCTARSSKTGEGSDALLKSTCAHCQDLEPFYIKGHFVGGNQ